MRCSLVAHLAAVAATRVQILASCQILYIKGKLGTESGPSLTLGTKIVKRALYAADQYFHESLSKKLANFGIWSHARQIYHIKKHLKKTLSPCHRLKTFEKKFWGPFQVKKQHWNVKFCNWAPCTISHKLPSARFFLFKITPPYCTSTAYWGYCSCVGTSKPYRTIGCLSIVNPKPIRNMP